MIKIFYVLILCVISGPLMTFEYSCKFEEVYLDGHTNNGFLLIKENNLRYEYFNSNLYGLVLLNDDLFYYDNKNLSNIKKTNQSKNLLKTLVDILNKYPNIEDSYEVNDYKINIEKSNQINFIYRLAISSKQLNMSIYFNDCKKIMISDIFFQTKPVIKFYYQ